MHLGYQMLTDFLEMWHSYSWAFQSEGDTIRPILTLHKCYGAWKVETHTMLSFPTKILKEMVYIQFKRSNIRVKWKPFPPCSPFLYISNILFPGPWKWLVYQFENTVHVLVFLPREYALWEMYFVMLNACLIKRSLRQYIPCMMYRLTHQIKAEKSKNWPKEITP